MNKESKRNKKAQFITLKDGSIKTIFHDKRFQPGTFKGWWDLKNTSPKPNSKRQRALRSQSQTIEP